MPCSASRSGTPLGATGQLTTTGFGARAENPVITSEISSAREASEPTMKSRLSIPGSAVTTSSASGSRAIHSGRIAVVGVRSIGLAADATGTRSCRGCSTERGASGGVASPCWAHWSTARTPLPPPNVTMPTPGPAGSRSARSPASRSETSTSSSTE